MGVSELAVGAFGGVARKGSDQIRSGAVARWGEGEGVKFWW